MKNNKIKCNFCNNTVEVTPKQVEIIPVTIGEEYLYATIFTCGICSNWELKQLDSIDTEEIVSTLLKMKSVSLKRQKLGKPDLLKQKEKASKLELQLSHKRKKLNQKYWEDVNQLITKLEITDQADNLGEVEKIC